LIGLAGIREQQQDYEGAIAIYEKVLEKQPGNAISTNNLAALLADHRSDEASLAKVIELSAKLEKANQPAFLDTAGWVYYRKGDYDKAPEILQNVVEKTPKVPVFQYHLGMVYYKQGNKDAEEARATLKSM
jgi:tetratricopeptide (TPR) repeat protein